jgi:hypothetical protein
MGSWKVIDFVTGVVSEASITAAKINSNLTQKFCPYTYFTYINGGFFGHSDK